MIFGWVWLDGDTDGLKDTEEEGLGGVTVYLVDSNLLPLDSTTTAYSGYYSFGVNDEGSYSLQFIAPIAHRISSPDRGENDTLDSDAHPITGRSASFYTTTASDNIRLDAGLWPSSGEPYFYTAPDGRAGATGTWDNPFDLAEVFAGATAAGGGATVWMKGGTYRKLDDYGKRAPYNVSLVGDESAPVVVRALTGVRATVDAFMHVEDAADAWFWGFEVTNSEHVYDDVGWLYNDTHGSLLEIKRAQRCKFINLDINGGGTAVGFWIGALDSELYGNTIHHHGYWNPKLDSDKDGLPDDRGHGHSIYTQNQEGTKTIGDNIFFYGYGYGIHLYSSSGNWLQGYQIEGNIGFSAGRMHTRGGLMPAGISEGNLTSNSNGPLDDLTFTKNYFYQPGLGTGDNAYFGGVGEDLGQAVITENYIMGLTPLTLGDWHDLTLRGNTLGKTRSWEPVLYLKYAEGLNPLPYGGWEVDENTYYGTTNHVKFWVKEGKASYDELTFTEYVARTNLGFDANSVFIDEYAPLQASWQPTRNFAVIRPNKYESGRANIVVYNWEGYDEVPVDLDHALDEGFASVGLSDGDRYVVHNVEDLWAETPVATGTYVTGGENVITLPMEDSRASSLEFDAFVVHIVDDAL